jgi:hypothetical protein
MTAVMAGVWETRMRSMSSWCHGKGFMRWLRIKTAGDALAVERQDELPELVQPEVDGDWVGIDSGFNCQKVTASGTNQ